MDLKTNSDSVKSNAFSQAHCNANARNHTNDMQKSTSYA